MQIRCSSHRLPVAGRASWILQVHRTVSSLRPQHTCWVSSCRCTGPSSPSPNTPARHLFLLPWHSILGRCFCPLSPLPSTLLGGLGIHVPCLSLKLDSSVAPNLSEPRLPQEPERPTLASHSTCGTVHLACKLCMQAGPWLWLLS